MRWFGHLSRKQDDNWVMKCMEYPEINEFMIPMVHFSLFVFFVLCDDVMVIMHCTEQSGNS